MFDRYTERARRALFFARYETSQLGGHVIATEHVLLGVVREAHGAVDTLLRIDTDTLDRLRTRVENASGPRERVATSVEIPFSDEVRRVLAAAAIEADALGHVHVGPEHLFLGILRESSTAAALLGRDDLTLESARTAIAQSSTTRDAD